MSQIDVRWGSPNAKSLPAAMLDHARMSLDSHLKDQGISDADLAVRIGVSPEAVRLWRRGKRRMSPETARAITEATGIPRHELRPDLWEAPEPTPGDRPAAAKEAA